MNRYAMRNPDNPYPEREEPAPDYTPPDPPSAKELGEYRAWRRWVINEEAVDTETGEVQ